LNLIQAVKKDEALKGEILLAKENGGSDAFDVWWLGQSGFLIQWNGICVLLDPYLSDSLTEKYAATNKPHVRMSERVIDPRALDCIDIVTSSHNHTDHLDAGTLIPLLEVNPSITFVISEANRGFVVERVKCNREFAEIELIKVFAEKMDVAVGIIDVKNYYIETVDDVVQRINRCLKYVPAEKLAVAPDCGLSQTARWASRQKLVNMVEGATRVRRG
jgi:hypothetical protein